MAGALHGTGLDFLRGEPWSVWQGTVAMRSPGEWLAVLSGSGLSASGWIRKGVVSL